MSFPTVYSFRYGLTSGSSGALEFMHIFSSSDIKEPMGKIEIHV